MTRWPLAASGFKKEVRAPFPPELGLMGSDWLSVGHMNMPAAVPVAGGCMWTDQV